MGKIDDLKAGGFTDSEIAQYQNQTTGRLRAGGFTDQEINDYLGVKTMNEQPLLDYWDEVLAKAQSVRKEITGGPDDDTPDLIEYVNSGWQTSVTGLAARGQMPDEVPMDAPIYKRLGMQVAQIAGDVPAMIVGAAAGTSAGGAAGTAVAGPAGTVTGGLLGGWTGANAVPEAMRSVMMEAYSKGEVQSFADFWERSVNVAKNTAISGVTGLLTGGAGKYLPGIAKIPGQIATMATVPKAMQGEMPEPRDFIDASVLFLGAKYSIDAADFTAQKLRTIYAKTGVKPQQVLDDAKANPELEQDILSSNPEVPPQYQPLVDAETARANAEFAKTEVKPDPKYQTSIDPLVLRQQFVDQGPGHQKIAGFFDKAVKIGQFTPEGRDVLLYILRNTNDDLLNNTNYKFSDAKRFAGRAAFERFNLPEGPVYRPPTVRLNKNVQTSPFAEAEKAANPNSVQRATLQESTFLHEYAHVGYRFMLAPEQLKTVQDVYKSRSVQEWQAFFEKGDSPRSADYFARSQEEFFVQSFAEYAITKKAPTPLLERLYKSLVDTLRNAMDNLRGRGNLGALEPIYEQILKGDVRPDLKVTTAEAPFNPANIRAGQVEIRNAADIPTQKPLAEYQPPAEPLAQPVLPPGADATGAAPPLKPPAPPAGGGGEPPQKPPSGRPDFVDDVLTKVSVGDQPKEKYSFDDLYSDAVDRLNPLKGLVERITQGEQIPATIDPYVNARNYAGATGVGIQFLKNGTVDFRSGKVSGESLQDILLPVRKNIDEFRAFVISKRAVELEGRGITSGIPKESAYKTVAAYEKQFGPTFERLKAYQDRTLQYLRDSGVLSEESYQQIKELNKDYVPFYRLFEEDAATGTGRGFTAKNPVKGITGSLREVIDPIESILKNTYVYTAIAEKNRVGNSLVDLAAKFPEQSADLVKKERAPMTPTKLSEGEVASILDEYKQRYGVSIDPTTFTIFRPNTLFPGPDQIVVYREGKRALYKVDPQVAEIFKGLDQESVSLLIRIASAPAKWLRAGVTLDLAFMVKNMTRDQFSASINSKAGYTPVFDFFKGLSSIIGKDEYYQKWLSNGGAMSSISSLGRQYIQEDMGRLLTDRSVLNQIKNPIQMLRAMSETVDEATRVGEFKKALKAIEKKGEEPTKADMLRAAFNSRELTLDFARRGSQVKAMNMLTAFFNAGIQGVDRSIRAIGNNPLKTSLAIARYITIPSILLYLYNRTDERYKDLPDWQKDTYWIIPAGEHIFRIPKPYDYGVIFGSGAERFVETILGQDPKAFDGFLKTIAAGALPNMMFTAMTPLVEVSTGKSFFTGGNLIPADREGLLPEYQYTPYTSELTKAISSYMARIPGLKESKFISPIAVDQYIRGWTGGLGTQIWNMADAALRKTDVLPDPPRPADTLADIPVVKAFVVRHPTMGTQPIQDFYDAYDSNQKAINSVKALLKEGRADAAIFELQQREGRFYQLQTIKQAMTNASKTARLVYQNPAIPSEDKNQLIDNLYYQVNTMAKAGLKLIEETDKSLEAMKQNIGQTPQQNRN